VTKKKVGEKKKKPWRNTRRIAWSGDKGTSEVCHISTPKGQDEVTRTRKVGTMLAYREEERLLKKRDTK